MASKIFSFENNIALGLIQRHNYYSLIWVTKGKGKVHAAFAENDFAENSLFSFWPYQSFMISAKDAFESIAFQFHSDAYIFIKKK